MKNFERLSTSPCHSTNFSFTLTKNITGNAKKLAKLAKLAKKNYTKSVSSDISACKIVKIGKFTNEQISSRLHSITTLDCSVNTFFDRCTAAGLNPC